MSGFAPIALQGHSAILTTSATPSTSASVPVVFKGSTNMNLGDNQPPQMRLLNIGSSTVWINISSSNSGTATIPTPGTTTLGTTQGVFWLYPLIEVTLTLRGTIDQIFDSSGNGLGIGIWLNMISAVASQSFYLQFGDGQ